MIRNTDLLYEKISAFQDEREKTITHYETALQSLAKYKGSAGYAEDLQKLQEKHENDLSDLRSKYSPSLQTVLAGMRSAIGKRTMKAPTAEQVNLLTVLQMRRKITADDTDRIAETLRDCPICVDLLSEIASQHNLHRDYTSLCPEMSNETALHVVDNLQAGVNDFLEFSTTRAARVADKFYRDTYGKGPETLPTRRRIENKEQCYKELCGLDKDFLTLFEGAVDA